MDLDGSWTFALCAIGGCEFSFEKIFFFEHSEIFSNIFVLTEGLVEVLPAFIEGLHFGELWVARTVSGRGEYIFKNLYVGAKLPINLIKGVSP